MSNFLRYQKEIKVNDGISNKKIFAHTVFFFLPQENVLTFSWVQYPKTHRPETTRTSPDRAKLPSEKSKLAILSMSDKIRYNISICAKVENNIKPLQNTSLLRTNDKVDKKRHFLGATAIAGPHVKPTEYPADEKGFLVRDVRLPEKPHIQTEGCR